MRPGSKAARELGVRSPLKEAKVKKQDIRHLSRRLGLPTWNKPSFACFASRFPYGTKITRRSLVKVDKAERLLRDIGITQVRVRQHDQIARIEAIKREMPVLFKPGVRDKITAKFKKLGYSCAVIDLSGYRPGGANA